MIQFIGILLSYSSLAYFAKVIIQIGLLLIFWWIGSLLQQVLNLPVSAGVIGLFLVLIGLVSGVFKLQWIKTGSDFMLAELVLFFIPCVVGLINYKSLFIAEGWQLITAIVLGTMCVMVFTAYTVHFCFKLESRLKQRSQDKMLHQHELKS
ncbi:CidA/LrgA family protein [Acinetobacter ursingii]|uniref:CidA/LrgA family protein n=1 Tax=Acinetobacter TaxID=469 RepID=UPI00148CD2D5|nr:MULTISPECIES: CidA/LrgA family protein [Acinetobacter]MDA3579186.1 CidA/LrgA family protein [Acinetobacter ursingii]MDG9861159.1 CidA/LrgA family protein [Acinetobacter ursingii]MDG9894750.1 CidA/LrgA family protein [Acinetobacter ursingii]MDH0008225.1 CidA/LrgA family protein [Acinetobacter ursingii]MDH0480025.1 CidA/LrgA family protein [Acinetobacter ursingii]